MMIISDEECYYLLYKDYKCEEIKKLKGLDNTARIESTIGETKTSPHIAVVCITLPTRSVL